MSTRSRRGWAPKRVQEIEETGERAPISIDGKAPRRTQRPGWKPKRKLTEIEETGNRARISTGGKAPRRTHVEEDEEEEEEEEEERRGWNYGRRKVTGGKAPRQGDEFPRIVHESSLSSSSKREENEEEIDGELWKKKLRRIILAEMPSNTADEKREKEEMNSLWSPEGIRRLAAKVAKEGIEKIFSPEDEKCSSSSSNASPSASSD